jgi:ComF family protein
MFMLNSTSHASAPVQSEAFSRHLLLLETIKKKRAERRSEKSSERKFARNNLTEIFRKILHFAKYSLCQEKCRICSKLIHPEVSNMDYSIYSPPGFYFVGNRRLESNTLCCSCIDDLAGLKPLVTSFILKDQRLKVAVISGTAFDGKVKGLIYRFKYDGDLLLSQDLSLLLWRAWQVHLHIRSVDFCSYPLFVPVPLHWLRLRQRGFNQSEIIARQVAKWAGVNISYKALKRVRRTRNQRELSKTERLLNVQNVFQADPLIVRGKPIILVDDVCTSGATILSCAEALFEAGASAVMALTIAKVK